MDQAPSNSAPKQDVKKPEAPKAPAAPAPKAPAAEAPSKGELRAAAGSHPLGFRNQKAVKPVASKMDPKKFNGPK